MKAITTLLFFALYFSTLHAQASRKHQVYFASDKHEISESELTKLKSFLRSLEASFIVSIQLTGHTDSDADEEYNIELSDRRVKSVQEVIATFDLSTIPIDSKFYGESKPVDENTHPEGKQNNRRVEIVAIPMRIEVPPPPKQTPDFVLQLPEIEGDTMITLPKGTKIVLPKKDYLANPTCVSVVEFVDGESVRAADHTTMTDDGDQLISAGMFDVKLCDENKCVKMYVPVRRVCGRALPFTQWTRGSDGFWSEDSGRMLDTVIINGVTHYEMTICRSRMVNCDVRKPKKKCKLFYPKTRVKLKNGYRITKIRIASNEPMTLATPLRQTKRKAVFFRTCSCTEPLLYLEATNEAGEAKLIDYQPLNAFDKREAFGPCKTTEVEKKILFFKIRKKTRYRKYLIRKSDFLNET